MGEPLAKHAAVVLEMGAEAFVFEDTRYFGRFTLDRSAIERLGPEPLGPAFTVPDFAQALKRSAQAVKVKLLDQSLVAGVGNIYASEALFRAEISPRVAARRLKSNQVERLWRAIREVLAEAIEWGSTIQVDRHGNPEAGQLFVRDAGYFSLERLRVYDRAGQPCTRCGAPIRRLVQAARSTYYCPACQRA